MNTNNVDERIVSMRFDNGQFESGVKTSLNTIDKLNNSLKFEGMSKSLSDVGSNIKSGFTSPLVGGLGTVMNKFSALTVIGVTALARITNAALDAGKKIGSALTIEPIKSGFSEYETQMNAVQTILANTRKEGTNVKIVNSALDELNTYADKTIYNFTEMTRNIGTFTAAGVKLDTSVSAIKGIANLAAVSGSTSMQASTAMYQLSQAIASGTVRLMDWNSVVNAGMGGQVFQDALIRTSEHLKTGAKAAVSAEGSFRESLQTGWLTTEVLTQTLDQFSTAADTQEEYEAAIKKFIDQGYSQEEAKQIADMAKTAGEAATKVKTFTQLIDTLKEALGSGWTTTWRLVIGDFEEAKSLWTNVSDVLSDMINESSNARNSMVKEWADAGGRTMLIDSLKNSFEGLMSVLKPIKEAFSDIFPPMTSEKLIKITEALKNLTEKFKISDESADKLKRTFKGVFALLDIGVQIIKALFGGFSDLLHYISPAADALFGFSAKTGDFIVRLDEAARSSNIFVKGIQKIEAVLLKIVDVVKTVIGGIKKALAFVGNLFAPVVESAKTASSAVDETLTGMADRITLRFGFIKSIIIGLKKVFTFIASIVQKVAPIISAVLGKVGEALSAIHKKIAESVSNADYNKIIDVINGGLLSAVIIAIRQFIKSATKLTDKTGNVVESFTSIFSGIKEILSSVSGAINAFTESIKAKTLKTVAVSIAILAGSLLVLSLIDSKKLTIALGAVTAMLGELLGSVATFNKITDGKEAVQFIAIAKTMTRLATALLILSVAMKIMSTMSWKELAVGLSGITGGLIALSVAVRLLPEKKVNAAARSLKKLSFAILILAGAFKIMGSMSWNEMAVGLTGMVVGLTALVAAVRMLPKKIVFGATGIVMMATAITILAGAFKIMGTMSFDELAVGLTGMSVGLLAMIVAIRAMPKDTILKSMGMVALAISMNALATALKIMGSMSWEEVAKSLVALAGSLIILAVGLTAMKASIPGAAALIVASVGLLALAGALKVIGTLSWSAIGKGMVALAGALTLMAISLTLMIAALPGAAALIVASVALALFAPVLITLGKVPWKVIGKGLLTIAALFGVMAIAGMALSPVAPVLLMVGAAVALFGAGCVLAGAGILALSVGFTALAAAIEVGGPAIMGAINTLISGIVTLVPKLMITIGKSIINFFNDEAIPLAESIFKVVITILQKLVEYIPTIVDLIFDFMIKVLNGIAKRLPELISAFVNVLQALLQGVIDALSDISPDVFIKGFMAIGALSAMMAALSASAALVPSALVGVIGITAVLAEIGAISQIPGLTWLIGEGAGLMESIGKAIGGLIGGIVGGFAEGVSSVLPQIGLDLSAFMANVKPFIEGAKTIDPSMLEGVDALIKTILLLTAADILNGIASWITGGSSLADFSDQLVPFGEAMVDFSKTVAGNIDEESVNAAANAGKIMAEMAKTIPTTGGVVNFFAGEHDMKSFSDQLVPFGEAMVDFSKTVAGKVDSDAVNSAANAGKMMADMAGTIPKSGGVVSFFTGDNDLSIFGDSLVEFGNAIVDFSETVAGNIDEESVNAAANAGKMMADMAGTIPKSGGVVGFFTGDNDMATFGEQLVVFGDSLVDFSESVSGKIDTEAVEAAATAGKIMTEMADTIPNTGGIVSFFTGDNDMADFGDQLVVFGDSLADFSESVKDIKPANVTAAALAGKALAEMADAIPDSGGLFSFFEGDNDIEAFGKDLEPFGESIAKFSDSVEGIKPANVTAAALAGKALAEMASNGNVMEDFFDGDMDAFSEQLTAFGKGIKGYADELSGADFSIINKAIVAGTGIAEMASKIPTSGGLFDKILGTSSDLSTFSDQLIEYGKAIKSFSEEVDGIKAGIVENATKAGLALIEMSKTIPRTGGLFGYLSGDIDMTSFGIELVSFGKSMKSFSESVSGIDSEAVINASTAGKALSELGKSIPSSGGLLNSIFGKQDMTSFGIQIASFGKSMKSFAESVSGMDSEAVINASTAGKALTELAKTIPSTGGLMSFLTGDNNIESFGLQLPSLGKSIKDFADSVIGLDSDAVSNATTAGKAIVELSKTVPSTGGLGGIFNGDGDITGFAVQLPLFGTSIKRFADAVSGIDSEAVDNAAIAGRAIIVLAKNVPTVGGLKGIFGGKSDISGFSNQIVIFGRAIKEFSNTVYEVSLNDVQDATNSGLEIIALFKNVPDKLNVFDFMSKIVPFGRAIRSFSDIVSGMDTAELTSNIDKLNTMIKGINNLGTEGIKGFVDSFAGSESKTKGAVDKLVKAMVKSLTNANDRFSIVGKQMINKLASAIKSNTSTATKNASTMTNNVIKTVSGLRSSFYDAGNNAVQGLADGINDNTYKATAKAAAMAFAAINAAKKALREHSPSKAMHEIGDNAGLGFVNALDEYISKSRDAGTDIADSAIVGLRSTISKVKDFVEHGMDSQPTIRPVLDLSEITSGAGTINRLLNVNPSIGVLSNVGSIDLMMNRRIQNGGNNEVISAIKDLGRTLGNNTGNTYTINGITYDDGSNISSAVESLIRAARVERRI